MVHLDAALMAEEEELWREFCSTMSAFTPEQAIAPGYFEEGWSAKDAMAHIGTWLAEAGVALEQLRAGTYVELRTDEIDEMNARFLDAMRDVSLRDVMSQATAARSRMLGAWAAISSQEDIAADWIRKAGPDHYREHLARLHGWLSELQEP
ncbi:MAG TPA: hypothetical protein VF351_10915 [Actinomycetota bacterium]